VQLKLLGGMFLGLQIVVPLQMSLSLLMFIPLLGPTTLLEIEAVWIKIREIEGGGAEIF